MVLVVVARGAEVDTVSTAVGDDENETRQDVSIFVKGSGGKRGQLPPTVFDFRRVGGDDVSGWFPRSAANSIVHAVVETRVRLARRRPCVCRGGSIVACIATCFSDVPSLRTYAVANDSVLNLKQEIVDRGPVLFALDVVSSSPSAAAARVPVCLLGWQEQQSSGGAWIVGLPIGATSRDLGAWWRNGCALIPFPQLPIATLDFIGCARASSLQTTHSEDTGTTRIQLFDTRAFTPATVTPLAAADDDAELPPTWTFYTDSALVVLLSVVALALVVLTAIGVYTQLKNTRYK